jgi:hypothetical protein
MATSEANTPDVILGPSREGVHYPLALARTQLEDNAGEGVGTR